jgi:hypothetical protein
MVAYGSGQAQNAPSGRFWRCRCRGYTIGHGQTKRPPHGIATRRPPSRRAFRSGSPALADQPETPDQARALLESGAGHRLCIGECLDVERNRCLRIEGRMRRRSEARGARCRRLPCPSTRRADPPEPLPVGAIRHRQRLICNRLRWMKLATEPLWPCLVQRATTAMASPSASMVKARPLARARSPA